MPKTLAAILLFSIIVIVYTISVIIAVVRPINMPLGFYTTTDYYRTLAILNAEYEPLYIQRTNQEYRKLIEDDLDLNFYIYCEKDYNKYDGRTYIVFRTMVIDKSQIGYDYCLAFVHEAMHFKKYSGQEDYICFETFKYLYENTDKELHNFGVRYGIEQLRGDLNGDADCHSQIIGYIKQRQSSVAVFLLLLYTNK